MRGIRQPRRQPVHLLLFVALLLLALALRVALWSQPLHQPANDEEEYIAVAYDLLAGHGWRFYTHYHWLRAPLYPLFLAGSLWLTGGDLHLAALPNIALSTANVALVALLTAALLPPATRGRAAAALTAALIAALLLTLNTFASLFMSETLFSFLFMASLVALFAWRRAACEQPHEHGRRARRVALLLLAGVLFGLATLTRSLTLAFAPVVLLWIAAQGWAAAGCWRIRAAWWAAAAGFALALAAPIAPWTLRNCQAYGRCIVVETGFSYNMWAFNEPHASHETIFRTLEAIPNPAERADVATAHGMQRLREDPAILWRKLWPNWVYLWRVKPIQDRFLMESYYGDPSPLLFLGALLLDDALYLALVMAALFGVIFGIPRHLLAAPLRLCTAPHALLLLWLLYVVVATMLTHGEARYRHFLFPVLIPYAALALCRLPGRSIAMPPAARWLVAGRSLLVALLLPLMLYTILSTYPWEWAARGARRSMHHLAGNIAHARGNLEAAAAAYERALVVEKTPDVFLALGDVRRQQGDIAAADSAYRSAVRRKPLYIAATARLGDLWRAQGDAAQARDYFAGIHADEQRVIDWSWRNLEPPPAEQIAVGDGLDAGYVQHVYPAEEQQGTLARWTDGQGRVRLVLPATPPRAPPQHLLVELRMAAPHPGSAGVPVQVCSAGMCQPLTLARTWRRVALLLPAAPAEQGSSTITQVLTVRSPTFSVPDAHGDERRLGVLLDHVRVEVLHSGDPRSAGPYSPRQWYNQGRR
jgi:4-amino-4-deoxy-L-arabinose transferase-like glycosyltransferase